MGLVPLYKRLQRVLASSTMCRYNEKSAARKRALP